MVEGRRRTARRQRESALAGLAVAGLVVVVALLVTSAGHDNPVRDLAAFRTPTLTLAGCAIALALAYQYRGQR